MNLNQIKLKQTPKWVLVFSSNNEITVHLLKSTLENESLPVMMNNIKDSFYHIGYIELYVPSEFEQEAKQLINKINV